jgi:hypothetical protein
MKRATPEVNRKRVREWTAANPLKKKERNLRRVGWTLERYNAAMVEQDGRCAICRVKLALKSHQSESVSCDHDHETNKPRGLLCDRCNRIEGLLAQLNLSPEEWVAALRGYLAKYADPDPQGVESAA